MSFSLIHDGLLAPILSDGEIAGLFSAASDIEAILEFEIALAHSEAEHGIIPAEAAPAIENGIRKFALSPDQIEAGIIRDGFATPGLVARLRDSLDADAAQYLHFGATSQDLIDTSLMLRLKSAVKILIDRISALERSLDHLHETHGGKPFMARTRMQAALPITLGDRIGNWRAPLEKLRSRLTNLSETGLLVQFAGPTGTLDKLGDKGPAVRRSLAERLGLGDPGASWQTDRSVIVDWGTAMSLITGSLGKLGQDVALMSQNGIDEVRVKGGGTSSAMRHKANPVNAEILVTLARFNAALLPALHHALVHEQERSGSAWTLEWMVLPQLCVTAGAATKIAGRLLSQIEFAA